MHPVVSGNMITGSSWTFRSLHLSVVKSQPSYATEVCNLLTISNCRDEFKACNDEQKMDSAFSVSLLIVNVIAFIPENYFKWP